jgi:hypothetical protein
MPFSAACSRQKKIMMKNFHSWVEFTKIILCINLEWKNNGERLILAEDFFISEAIILTCHF